MVIPLFDGNFGRYTSDFLLGLVAQEGIYTKDKRKVFIAYPFFRASEVKQGSKKLYGPALCKLSLLISTKGCCASYISGLITM